MSDSLITFDTNILIYSIDIDAGEKHQIAVALLESAFSQPCFLTVQVLSEFFSVAIRKKGIALDDAMAQIEDWQKLFPVVSATKYSLTKAIYAVKNHHLAFWDAMLWAVAAEHHASILFSEDFQTGRELEGVRFTNPFLQEVL